jgi:ribosomal protein L27
LDLVFRDQFFAWLIKKDKAAPQRPRQHYSGWVKRHDGNIATGGSIFVGARTPVPPGLNVGLGKDDTLFAKVDGRILRRPRPWSQNQFCPG